MLAVALLPPLLRNELVIPSVSMAPMVAVGAWCMPTSMLRKPYGSVLTMSREVWTRQVAVLTSWQLLVGAATAVILVLMDLIELQVAGAAGMAVALGMSLISGDTKDEAAPESTEDAPAS
ncbi:hypothetical protein [Kocuria palustris]|uniref:hypothetical protein n=1 Tax=Kocuria palustris TaxID=71999 RepID=UPI002043F83F|nr:hypothetical protein [Kocuria palustris]MCM3332614.1 hypothetical protein [Kocuria palustris]